MPPPPARRWAALIRAPALARRRYISAIKTLRLLDSSGVLLERVCEPVRAYLRSRNDTVRCVVTSLTDDGNSELFEELSSGVSQADVAAAEEDAEAMASWLPDPVDADPTKSSASRRRGDVTSLLIDIYGSQELFVTEYRSLLAERLLALTSFDTDRDLRNLELLKLRFGEEAMHMCVVMLKDIADSKRMNAVYNEQLATDGEVGGDFAALPLNVFVLSRLFWPAFREESYELPPLVQRKMKHFTESFEALKAARTLDLKPNLGTVQLSLELANRTVRARPASGQAPTPPPFSARAVLSPRAVPTPQAAPAPRVFLTPRPCAALPARSWTFRSRPWWPPSSCCLRTRSAGALPSSPRRCTRRRRPCASAWRTG